PPPAVLQIDWPLWLCDCCIVSGLVRNVELINALRSFSTEGKLKVNRLCNRRCQQDSKKTEFDWARQAMVHRCVTIWFATVRFLTCTALTLLCLTGSKQPFELWDCKLEQQLCVR